MGGKHLLVTTVKDEGPFILEWVAWHRLAGFDPILVYQNGSTDLTQRSLRVMDQHGLIQYIPNDHGRSSPQIRAYTRASEHPAFTDAEWCLALDGDEFFVSHVGRGTVAELTEHIGSADAMLINWRNFGSAGQREMSDALVTERFTQTVERQLVARHLVGFKSLFRTSAFSRIGIHNARFPRKENLVAVNGSGLSDGHFERLNWRCKDPGGMALAQINHYPIKDAASFLLKTLRGRGHQNDYSEWERYWRRFDHNQVRDLTLAGRVSHILAEMQRMDEVSNGRLGLIRRKSLRIWQTKIAEALSHPQTRDLYDRILAMIQPPDLAATEPR